LLTEFSGNPPKDHPQARKFSPREAMPQAKVMAFLGCAIM
jgi:hypothetical protein